MKIKDAVELKKYPAGWARAVASVNVAARVCGGMIESWAMFEDASVLVSSYPINQARKIGGQYAK